MSSVYPLQQTFEQGIISRRVTGRSQIEAYANALAECTNWQIKPQGSMRYRNGSQYLAQAQGIDSKLINFSLPDRDDFMVEVGQNEIIIYNADGTIAVKAGSGGNIVGNVLTDSLFQQNFAQWDWTSKEVYSVAFQTQTNGRQPLAVPNVGVDFIYNNRTQSGSSEPRYAYEYTVSQDFDIPLVASTYKFKSVLRLSGENVFNANNDYRVTVTVKEKNGAVKATQAFLYDSSSQFNVNLPIELDFVSNASISRYTLTIKHEQVFTNNLDFLQFPDFSCRQSGIEIKEVGGGGGSPEEPAVFTSPYTGKDLQAIQTATDTGTGQLVIVHPDVNPDLLLLPRKALLSYSQSLLLASLKTGAIIIGLPLLNFFKADCF